MNKERKFQERILANMQSELLYATGKGDREQIELLKMQIMKQKEVIDEYLSHNK